MEWREYRGFSQEEACERMDISTSTLSRIENGKLPYNQDFLEKAALAYGCDVTDLLDLNPVKPDPPRLIYDQLRAAPQAMQDRALAILEALLKAS